MNPDMRRALLGSRHLSLAEIEAKDPRLAKELSALMRQAEAAEVKAAILSEAPKDVRKKFEEVDFTDIVDEDGERLEAKLIEIGVDSVVARRIVSEHHHRHRHHHHHKKAKQAPPSTTPVGVDPAVAAQIALAQVNEVNTIAGLAADVATAVAKTVTAQSGFDDATLTSLVSSGTLTDAQAQSVGFSAALYGLADENTALATAIRSATFSHLGGKPAASTVDLAKLGPADWTGFLTSSKSALPAGVTPAAAGASLAARFASMHPGVALLGRLPQVDVNNVGGLLADLGPLFALNPQVVGVSHDKLVTRGLSAAQLAAALTAQSGLQQLANAYPGLGLAAVLDDPKLDAKTKGATVAHRVSLVQQIATNLGSTQVLRLDLSNGSADLPSLGLEKLGATADEQAMVLSTLKAYQRAWVVAKNIDDTHALVSAGYASAMSVATLPLQAFTQQSGLPAATARGIWTLSRSVLADNSATVASIIDLNHGLFDRLRYNNQAPSAQDYLAQIPGYAQLFGNISFCDCEECRSILSPAAYFVDLMKYIEENLLPIFDSHPNHPLDLRVRRPDLWTLPLTCDNTNDRVPTLDIINQILATYIENQTAVADVYGQTLAAAPVINSFLQPFHLPITRIDSYMKGFKHTRAEVATAMGASANTMAQAELGLSDRQFQIIAIPDATAADLAVLYGADFTTNRPKAPDLQLAMGVTRIELGQIVKTWFVAQGHAPVSIVAGKLDANSVQNDVEWVMGVTADALDRMHRFTRLVRKVGWTIPDLDLVLQTMGDSTLAPPQPPAVGAPGVTVVGRLHAVQSRFGVAIPDLCALVGPIVQAPSASISLFDQLFNQPAFVASGGKFPPPAAPQFFHPAFRTVVDPGSQLALPRLLAGLGLDVAQLESLIRGLAPHLAQQSPVPAPPAPQGFNPDDPNESNRYFVLSPENLTRLYRHARLSRLLAMSIDDLFQLLRFVSLDHVGGLDDLTALLDIFDWRTNSNYTLDDIGVATGQVVLDDSNIAATVLAAATSGVMFTSTVFAAALGASESGSLALLTSNSPNVFTAAVPASLGVWRITAGVDINVAPFTIPAAVTVPAPATGGLTTVQATTAVTPQMIVAALAPYLPSEALKKSLGAALNLPKDKVGALAALAGATLSVDLTQLAQPAAFTAVTSILAKLRPLATAFKDTAWDQGAIAALVAPAATAAAVFGAPLPAQAANPPLNPNAPFVSLQHLRGLSTYAQISNRLTGNVSSADGQQAVQDLQAVLVAFTAAAGFSQTPSNTALLAEVLGVSSGLVVGLRSAVAVQPTAAASLAQLERVAQLSMALTVDGATLVNLVSTDYGSLSSAADALTTALSRKYTDPTSQANALETVEQPVRQAKRDALADYLTRTLNPTVWHTLDDLYQYFLIDVATGGCATTSWLVSATMTAQLYVQRAIMNLEHDAKSDVTVTFGTDAAGMSASAEWVWRKNYRVWQANREVFLWPENYLDPDLRDDKTPLFKDLESALLQSDISDEDVLDAYTNYLTGFQELGTLTLAGAYHDVPAARATQSPPADGSTDSGDAPSGIGDVLHMVAASSNDPPNYYYKTCTNLITSAGDPSTAPTWSAWQPINVQITSRKVTPVVYLGRLHLFWLTIQTKPLTSIVNSSSVFTGYSHTMSLKYTSLRPNLVWTGPQDIRIPATTPGITFTPGDGQVQDLLQPLALGSPISVAKYDTQLRPEPAPIDGYTLSGANWEWCWPRSSPSALQLQFRNFMAMENIDLFSRHAVWQWAIVQPRSTQQLVHFAQSAPGQPRDVIYSTIDPTKCWCLPSGFANSVVDADRGPELTVDYLHFPTIGSGTRIAQIPADTQTMAVLAVPGSEQDVIVQVNNARVANDMLYLQASASADGNYVLRRLNTTLAERIARSLFEQGVPGVLSLATQNGLFEAASPVDLFGPADWASAQRAFDGPCGVYYQELFFHIPFLIANALHSRGRYDSARRWYEYIFNPTAALPDVTGLPQDVADQTLRDNVWQCVWLRLLWRDPNAVGMSLDTLRSILTDPVTLALYEHNPFNPWAIARKRLSALQKTIVMKYVENLLDWADSLFTQFTSESVNEALMLYIMALDVLGPRPTELGDCGTVADEELTYQAVSKLMDGAGDMLVELETWTVGARVAKGPPSLKSQAPGKYVTNQSLVAQAITGNVLFGGAQPAAAAVAAAGAVNGNAAAAGNGAGAGGNGAAAAPPAPKAPAAAASAAATPGIFRGMGWTDVRTTSWGPALASAATTTPTRFSGRLPNFSAAVAPAAAMATANRGAAVKGPSIDALAGPVVGNAWEWDPLESTCRHASLSIL